MPKVADRSTHAAIATVAAVAVSACSIGDVAPGGSSRAADTLRVAITGQPASLDPAVQQSSYETAVARAYAEPLLKPKPDLSDVMPGAAAAYDVSSDGLTYTFHLGPGGYPDGTPVRAQDFVYGWTRVIDPRVNSPVGDLFATAVKGGDEVPVPAPGQPAPDAQVDAALKKLALKAVDDRTFQVVASRRTAYFKWLAAMSAAAPVRQDVVEKYGPRWAVANPQTTQNHSLQTNGPFTVTEIAPGDHLALEPNPHYGGARPAIKKLLMPIVQDPTTALVRYSENDFDITPVPLSATGGVAGNARLKPQLVQVPSLLVYWVEFNQGRPPFDNPKVRAAFAQAIDRQDFVNTLLKGHGLPATSLVPRGQPGHRPDSGRGQAFNPAGARQMLESAGLPADGFRNVTFLFADRPGSREIADYLVGAWKANLGVEIRAEPFDPGKVGQRFQSGDYFVGGPGAWKAEYPDQQNWLDIFRSGDPNNVEAFRSAQYDQLVRQGDTDADPQRRDGFYAQAEKLLSDLAVVAFLYQAAEWYLVKPWVKSYQDTPLEEWPGAYYPATITVQPH
jgi:ABC-type oligopeptide transport system substrate-binding subunit